MDARRWRRAGPGRDEWRRRSPPVSAARDVGRRRESERRERPKGGKTLSREGSCGPAVRSRAPASLPPRDGNGYIPVGYWPPIPVPARTKFYSSDYPYPYMGRKMFSYPYPAGNLYPTGNPYPKSIPENYI